MNKIVGDVVVKSLKSVTPNPWNPNYMTEFAMKSLKNGLSVDGWLKNQSLLIWGVDNKGKRRDTIIDGEHRWAAATELGFEEGPMVFLDGLTEAQAKALTVKMNSKRGKFDEEGLGELLRSIQGELGVEDFGLDVGIGREAMDSYLAIAKEFIKDPLIIDPNERAEEPVVLKPTKCSLIIDFEDEEALASAYKEAVGKGLKCRVGR